ncbi:MAG TPA: NAD(P)-binding domain-containing protein [Trebonia sp.]|nr:NAD(P)-binding domain-containing protein [Trebonia sp.]
MDRLVGAGHEVTVLGRSPEVRKASQSAGARPVADASGVADKADVVCVCVFSDEQVRSIALDDGLVAAMPGGSTLVIHTTGSPRTAQVIASAGAAHGVAVIDSPVSGGPHDIAAGHITLLVGGADADVDRARPVLSAYGDPILHVGPLGAGREVAADLGATLGVLDAAIAELEALTASRQLAQSAASIAVQQLTGDFQVTGVRCGLLDDVQDHHANVGYLIVAVSATGHVRQADAGQYLVGPIALLAVVAEHVRRRAIAGEGHFRVVRRPPLIPRQVRVRPCGHLLEPVPLRVPQVLNHSRDGPARCDDRRVPGTLLQSLDDGAY